MEYRLYSARELLSTLITDKPLSNMEYYDLGIYCNRSIQQFWANQQIYSNTLDSVDQTTSYKTSVPAYIKSEKLVVPRSAAIIAKQKQKRQRKPKASTIPQQATTTTSTTPINQPAAKKRRVNKPKRQAVILDTTPDISPVMDGSRKSSKQTDLPVAAEPQSYTSPPTLTTTSSFVVDSKIYTLPPLPSFSQLLSKVPSYTLPPPYMPTTSTTTQLPPIGIPNTGTFECEFEGCHRIYQTKAGAKHHHKTLHQEMARFACLACTKVYATKSGLNYHVKGTHKKNSGRIAKEEGDLMQFEEQETSDTGNIGVNGEDVNMIDALGFPSIV